MGQRVLMLSAFLGMSEASETHPHSIRAGSHLLGAEGRLVSRSHTIPPQRRGEALGLIFINSAVGL